MKNDISSTFVRINSLSNMLLIVSSLLFYLYNKRYEVSLKFQKKEEVSLSLNSGKALTANNTTVFIS